METILFYVGFFNISGDIDYFNLYTASPLGLHCEICNCLSAIGVPGETINLKK